MLNLHHAQISTCNFLKSLQIGLFISMIVNEIGKCSESYPGIILTLFALIYSQDIPSVPWSTRTISWTLKFL